MATASHNNKVPSDSSGLTLQSVRTKVVDEIEDALEREQPDLIEALPGTGKSRGVIEAASRLEVQIAVFTCRGRKEQYLQLQRWCDNFGLSSFILPSAYEDCPTVSGNLGEERAEDTPADSVAAETTESDSAAADSAAAETAEPETAAAEAASTEDVGERDGEEGATEPETLAGHVAAVVGRSTETVRLLDDDATLLADGPASDAVATVESAEPVPATVILDGTLTQALLDVAAQRGVTQVVARETGEFVKRPTAVRIRSPEEF